MHGPSLRDFGPQAFDLSIFSFIRIHPISSWHTCPGDVQGHVLEKVKLWDNMEASAREMEHMFHCFLPPQHQLFLCQCVLPAQGTDYSQTLRGLVPVVPLLTIIVLEVLCQSNRKLHQSTCLPSFCSELDAPFALEVVEAHLLEGEPALGVVLLVVSFEPHFER